MIAGSSVRNNGRSTATRLAALWQDRQVFAPTGPGDRQLVIGNQFTSAKDAPTQIRSGYVLAHPL